MSWLLPVGFTSARAIAFSPEATVMGVVTIFSSRHHVKSPIGVSGDKQITMVFKDDIDELQNIQPKVAIDVQH
jgi:hypothetical protein